MGENQGKVAVCAAQSGSSAVTDRRVVADKVHLLQLPDTLVLARGVRVDMRDAVPLGARPSLVVRCQTVSEARRLSHVERRPS